MLLLIINTNKFQFKIDNEQGRRLWEAVWQIVTRMHGSHNELHVEWKKGIITGSQVYIFFFECGNRRWEHLSSRPGYLYIAFIRLQLLPSIHISTPNYQVQDILLLSVFCIPPLLGLGILKTTVLVSFASLCYKLFVGITTNKQTKISSFL